MGGILPIITGVLGAVGSVAQSSAASAGYKAQAEAEKMNAQIAGINAEIAASEGKRQQAQASEDAYRAMGRQRAALAEGGLLNSATGILMQDQAQREADEERLRIGRAAEMEALNHKIQKSNALNSAGILASNAKSSRTGGVLAGVGGILGGTAQGYSYKKEYGSWF
jgi:hypothetical protein